MIMSISFVFYKHNSGLLLSSKDFHFSSLCLFQPNFVWYKTDRKGLYCASMPGHVCQPWLGKGTSGKFCTSSTNDVRTLVLFFGGGTT